MLSIVNRAECLRLSLRRLKCRCIIMMSENIDSKFPKNELGYNSCFETFGFVPIHMQGACLLVDNDPGFATDSWLHQHGEREIVPLFRLILVSVFSIPGSAAKPLIDCQKPESLVDS
jgi:hypothetical protein